jgi:succinyl-diaminopimelate desuccinylase
VRSCDPWEPRPTSIAVSSIALEVHHEDDFWEGASGASSETTPLAMKLAESVRETSGRPARFELCPGLLETRFYQQLNIPAYAYGPGLFSVAHGPEEWVGLEEITRCAAVYALTALRFLGSR